MTREHDFIGLLEGYLDEFEGFTPLPDATREAVRREIPSVHQRPAWWPGGRFPSMNSTAKLALAAAAVILVAFFGFNLFRGANIGAPELNVATPSPTVEASPTPLARLGGQAPLDPGRYVASTEPTFDVTVAVPSGWSASDGWVVIGPRDNDAPDGMAIRFYTVENLAANPLLHADGVIDPPLGPTVDDLVQAVVAHPAWETSTPTDITIDGHPGQLVQLTIPMDAQLGAAPNDRYYLSLDPLSGGIWGWEPGQTFDWYIVDVDGSRFVIDAFHYPGTSEEDLAAQREVVESIEFDLH